VLEVFLDDHAPSYPRTQMLWLTLEGLAFPTGALARQISPEPDWRPIAEFEEFAGVITVDLSERVDGGAGGLVLRYDGEADSCALIRRLLSRELPRLAVHRVGEDDALAASSLAIEDRFSISRGLQTCFARCISLIDRALRPTAVPLACVAQAAVASDRGSLAAFVPGMMAHKLMNLITKPLRRPEHWQVALRRGAGAFTVVQDDGTRFYADPFLQRMGDRTFILVEDYPYAARKGVISAAEVVGDRLLGAPIPVLERPYHLSYPFVFEHEGEFYMMPETGENRTVELYRAIQFPWKWQLDAVLLEGAVFSDATILVHGGLWWLFLTTDRFGASTQDELSIFCSETLRGPWVPHAGNPVKSDSRSSRPAGRIVVQNGRLFRPAQDCARTYGAGIVWFEITELTPTRFSEREVAVWDGQAELSMDGFHSFDQLGPLQAIDVKGAVGRGALRRHVRTIAVRSGGELARSFSGDPTRLRLDGNPSTGLEIQICIS
jgi:hypothetical protein